MPFPIGAVIGAVAGIGSAVLGSASNQAAQNAQYQEAEKQAKKRFERDVAEWELANEVAETQWWWDKARIEQLRFNERQKESDYYGYQGAMIGAATKQLGARIDGLKMGLDSQMYGLGMSLGARMDGLALGLASQMNSIALRDNSRLFAASVEAGGQMNQIALRAAADNQLEASKAGLDYSSRMQALTIETLDAAQQYMIQANQQALEAGKLTDKINRDSQELVASLVFEEQRDMLGWQLNKIAALADSSQAGNVAITRQGGGKTSKLLMAQAAKQLGRTWGEMEIKSKSRKERLGLLNSAISNDYAKQMAQYSLATQGLAERRANLLKRSDNEAKTLSDSITMLTIPSLAQRNTLANAQMTDLLGNAIARFSSIAADNMSASNAAMVDFTVARRSAMTDYAVARESAVTNYTASKQAALADFGSTIASYSRPFRQEEYFDPLKPIPGLKPEYIGPTQPSGGNAVFTIGNAILGGVQGAMSFSYQNKDGGLSFY